MDIELKSYKWLESFWLLNKIFIYGIIVL